LIPKQSDHRNRPTGPKLMKNINTPLAVVAALAARSKLFLCALAVSLSLLGPLPALHAALTATGDVSPSDPTTWTSSTDACVGNTSDGTLTVDNGSNLASGYSYLGDSSGSVGTATVSGARSTWSAGEVVVGESGSGTLNVIGGGTINFESASLGAQPESTGVVTVDGPDSTWTNFWGPTVGNYGSGTLNITGGGIVNNRHGTMTIGSYSVGVVTVDGNGSLLNSSDAGENLFIGFSGGSGMLNITHGGTVNGYSGQIGAFPGSSSTSVVNVDGSGSTWTTGIGGEIYVGLYGNGAMNITGGGTVSSVFGFVGYQPGSSGVVTVDGVGSKWTVTDNMLRIGSSNGCIGTLNISGGGAMTEEWVPIASNSVLGIDVGKGSSLTLTGNGTITGNGTTVTNGTITNNGTVRILAGAGVAAGNVYSPISATTWSGSGVYQALGGTWNPTSHMFTVSDVQQGTSGAPVTIDLDGVQRVLIGDSGTGWSVGASFLASATSNPLTLTATTIGGSTLSALQSLLGPQQATLLGGWQFAFTSGYAQGDPAYLSFDIGAGYSRNGLEVWHYDGSSWTEFAANDLTYDGNYASFTVTGFSSYAVTTVPEPSTLVLLGIGAVSLIAYAWPKRKKLHKLSSMFVAVTVVLTAGVAQADVLNMGGTRDATTGT
jgi:T5SS/PEP-CTERM-associated repeat protein